MADPDQLPHRIRTDTDVTHARPVEPSQVAALLPEAARQVLGHRASEPRIAKQLADIVNREAFDSWATDRAGNPAWMMEGWQVTSHRDVVQLQFDCTAFGGTYNPEWKIARIAPIDHRWLDRRKRLARINRDSARQFKDEESQLRGLEKRQALVTAIENGQTVGKALDLVGIPPATYSKWRSRYPEFVLEIERAKAERVRAMGGDTTPAGSLPDFTEFRRHYFGYETYEHHRRIIEAIETTPPGGFTMILVPPEAGKTTLLEDWMCYRIALDPNYRMLLCTEAGTGESSQAKKMLSTIKQRLTDPEAENPDAQYPLHQREFLAKYGPFRDPQEDKDKPWNANYIKVHRASGRRDYTVQCCGWRSKVYGARCDDLLFDDTQSSESLNLTENIVKRMRGTFFSRPGKTGRIIYIGTKVGLGDVPERLIESGAIDRLVIIPALDADGNSYCPEMWPEEALAQKRRLVQEAAWWTNYMQDPRRAENPTFDRELTEEARDASRKACQVRENERAVLGLDPALGGHTSLSCCSWTPQLFAINDIWDQPGLSRNEEIFSMVADFARRYRPAELVVEINSMQRGIARDDRLRDLARTHGFTITEHETTNTKWDRDFGVASMAGSFIRREIVIPDGDDFSRRRMDPLLAQMEQWRPNVPAKLLRQDMLMSVWFPWRRWMEWREASRIDEAMWQAAGTPWGQGGGGTPWGGTAESLSVFARN